MIGTLKEQRMRVCIILKSPIGMIVTQSMKFKFQVTNNQSQYEVLLVGLQFDQGLDVRHIIDHSNL